MAGQELLTCAVLNMKPGTGKTTTAVWIAASLHVAGWKTLLVDADPGKSALRWSDLAGGFPWSLVGLDKRTILRDVRTLVDRSDFTAVVIDCPQMEDHAAISHGAMTYCDRWIVPVAPSGIEIDRMGEVQDHMDQVDAARDRPADRLGLLNRTNRRRQSKSGPDKESRDVLTEDWGLHVFGEQVQHNDDLFRQTFGVLVEPAGTAYEGITAELVERHKRVTV